MFTKYSQPVRVARHMVAVGVAALCLGAASADADEAMVPTQKVVGYSDLDLSKESDVRSLYARLQKAAARVCDQGKDLRDLRIKDVQDACYQESLARAVDEVGHASVKAIFVADERIRVAGRSSKGQPRS